MRFLRQILRGKTLYRFFMDEAFRRELPRLTGKVLDLASGAASYRRFFSADTEVLRTDYRLAHDVQQVVDCNQPFPFVDQSFDAVLLANALYILEDRAQFWREARRVLRPGGTLIVCSPFIANEMPEPHDYERLTKEGLIRELAAVPWRTVRIERLGERFSAAANLLHPAWGFSFVRVFVYGAALLLDRCIPARARVQHPCPLGYIVIATV